MLFKRRNKDGFWTRLRVYFWPRRNHARSSRYVWKRVMRIRATPRAIALGFAIGVFASFTPFMGFHFVLSFALAWLLRASFIAAGLGTAVGNPLTFPFIWAATLGLGRTILGRSVEASAGAEGFLHTLKEFGFKAVWDPYILPMAVGGIPLGVVAAALFYFPLRKAVGAFQQRRLSKKISKAQAKTQELANTSDIKPKEPAVRSSKVEASS
ncbi:DUF2062 domain-containing protein [Ahrensia marina]|uniref:Membrane protein n=1 Tax=Ahrensia marina TaxID=1514904 RepID=A0A0M9GPK4_9HYPH|nr:DUF2062 domain-containing protein [Ahrensia marina]KPB02366.1 membrane protein [Ahrensia marina]